MSEPYLEISVQHPLPIRPCDPDANAPEPDEDAPVVQREVQAHTTEKEEDWESYDIPFGSLPVCAFADPILRQAIARYWAVPRATQWNEQTQSVQRREGGGVLWRLLSWISPTGISDAYRERNLQFGVSPETVVPLHVDVVINYPTHQSWCYRATIPSNEIGQVFAIAHDMYRQIYAMDDAAWERKAPRAPDVPGNRASGKHVWGHDIEDLQFEGLEFLPAPALAIEELPAIAAPQGNLDEFDAQLEREHVEAGDTCPACAGGPVETVAGYAWRCPACGVGRRPMVRFMVPRVDPADSQKQQEPVFIGTVCFAVGS